MKNMKSDTAIFIIGGVGYGIIEILWRRHTHPTMILAGGISFLLFSKIAKRYREKPLVFKAALCALGVTAVELVFGLVFNMIFKMHVWDYSNRPFNLFGQICPEFTLAWAALAMLFVPLADLINKKVEK